MNNKKSINERFKTKNLISRNNDLTLKITRIIIKFFINYFY